jgi:hypothetical protein
MSWFPQWSSILGAAVVIGVLQGLWRLRRIRRQYPDHRVARFFGLPLERRNEPKRVYWVEGVTRAEVEDALDGRTDNRWGWLYRPAVRRTLVIANPASWLLVIYGATDLPLNLGSPDTAWSWWWLPPIPLWFAVRRSVRLVADAPEELLDERLVALRNDTYVTSYRAVAAAVTVVAGLLVLFGDAFEPNAETRDTLLRFVIAGAYAAIWALPALPSVVLAWTLRSEGAPAPD